MKLKNKDGVLVSLEVPDTLNKNISTIVSEDIFRPIRKETLTVVIAANPIVINDVVVPILKPRVLTYNKNFIGLDEYATNKGFIEPHLTTTWVIGKIKTDVETGQGDVINVTSAAHLVNYPFTSLEANTTYYVKAKMSSKNYNSEWSDVATIVTVNKMVTIPTLTITGPSLFPTVTVSEFVPVGYVDTIDKTILNISPTSDFIAADDIVVAGLKHAVTSNLIPDTTYYIRAKHVGNILESDWSEVSVITTIGKTDSPVLSGGVVGIENDILEITIENHKPGILYNVSTTGGEATVQNNKLFWKLPIIVNADIHATEEHAVFISAISTKYPLKSSDRVRYNAVVSNIPSTSDMFLSLSAAQFKQAIVGNEVTFTSDRISQNTSDTDFVTATDTVLTESAINILDPQGTSTKTVLKYNSALYTPMVNDRLVSDVNTMHSVLEFNVSDTTIKIDNNYEYIPRALYKPSNLEINGERAVLVLSNVTNAKLISSFSETVFTKTRELIFKVTGVLGDTITGLTSGINKGV